MRVSLRGAVIICCAAPLQRLVVKPDQLIKRRGKLGLVGVNLDLDGVRDWLKSRMMKETAVRSPPTPWLMFVSQQNAPSINIVLVLLVRASPSSLSPTLV